MTEFPGGDAAHLSGLRVLSSLRPGSPGRRFAPPPGKERRVAGFPGGDAAHLSGLRVLSEVVYLIWTQPEVLCLSISVGVNPPL
ncbi:hypothetical protein, partial [Klebsiella oxytoca]|uniref:hypothetical protein n=1 Tax=Klebsiella oxytoca TaxID=571 RepID=UPI0029312152